MVTQCGCSAYSLSNQRIIKRPCKYRCKDQRYCTQESVPVTNAHVVFNEKARKNPGKEKRQTNGKEM